MKKAFAFFLAAVLLLGMIPAAAAETPFTDVKATDWFAEDVYLASEAGLMQGVGSGKFGPDYRLSVGQGLAIACRLHSARSANGQQFVQGTPWYQVYVDYAVQNKIMAAGQLEPERTITREQFAYLMCGAIPSAELPAINSVTEIPDVSESSAYGGFVYRLYRAGVLTGSDSYGTFKPTAAIRRCEIATIVMRLADASRRKSFTLEKNPAAVTDIFLRGNPLLTVGETAYWDASPLPSDAPDSSLFWASGNPGVASVDQNGAVTGLKPGMSNISVTAKNGVQKIFTVLVAAPFSPDTVYEQLISMKAYLPEGTPWTNDNTFTLRNMVGGGCVGFALEVTSAAFGKLPLRTLRRGEFTYEDLRVGDMPRINNDSHTVVILEIHSDHVVIAEGNYLRTVHWGRSVSRETIMQADYVWTRYPE